MLDIKEKRHIQIVGKGGASTVTWDDIQDKPEFATVATSGDYDDLTDKPTIPAAQVNSDWNASSGVAQILNKPTLATVATTGSYNDLTDKPTILTQWFGTQAEYDAIAVKDPNTVYNIEGSDNVQPDWNQSDSTADDYIKNKPTIPAAQVNSDWNANSGVSQILNKPTLATVATTGNYSDLNGTPTIPAAPVQSDWNEADNTSLAYIANKPTIPAAQVNADWNSASGVSQILNKPTIPTVPPMATETLTFTLQGGTVKTIEFYTKPMSANYFYVQDLSGVPNDVTIMCGDMIPIFDIYTSTDQTNWNYLGTTGDFVTLTETIPLNGKLYFKAVTDYWGGGIQISCSHSHKIGGNIMSLLYGDNYFDTTLHPDYNINAFSGLFTFDSELVDASDLVLPSNVVMGCYQNMFNSCSSLTTAPVLPATTLADNCYMNMFMECSSLDRIVTYAQDISATDCLYNWLNNVAATGDFYNLGGATYTSGVDGIPSGWTEHTSL